MLEILGESDLSRIDKRNFTKFQISKFASQDLMIQNPTTHPHPKKTYKNTCLLLYVLTFVSMSFVDIAGLIWIHSVSLVFS